MVLVNKVLVSPLILAMAAIIIPTGVNARLSLPPIQNKLCYHRYTTPNTISHSRNKYSRYSTTKTTSNSIIQHSILQIRGGGIFGTSKSNDEEEYEYYELDDNTSNEEYYYEEEDTDYLLSTPIPTASSADNTAIKERDDSDFSTRKQKQQAVAEQKRVQKEEKKRKLIEKKRLAAAEQAKHKRDLKTKARQNKKEKEKNENEYLLETPAIENKSRKKSQSKRSKRRSQWLPQSSSKTSSALVAPSSGGIINRGRSLSSIKSYNYSAILSSLSGILSTVIQPIKNILTSITHKIISLLSKYISILWSILLSTFDYVWYGPINGVTTTGIINRHGGLQSLLFNTQIGMTISYIVGLTLLSVLVTKLWNIKPIGDDNDSDEDDDDDAYYVDPPTVEEELRFLYHDFNARNPLAKERIAKVITKKQNRCSLPERRRQRRDMKKDDSPRNRKGRRKHAIESIQSWWKERPGQRSISIIEPQHIRNSQQSKTQSQESMRRLQKQLMESEQEREIMSRDIRDLKHDLQRAHDDSRSIVSQNKWLEKQTSQIMEAEQARDSVKGVLDRERTRRFAENERKNQLGRGYNDLDLDKTRRGTRLADYELPNNLAKGFNDLDLNSMGRDASRRFDGVRITREIDKNDDYDAM